MKTHVNNLSTIMFLDEEVAAVGLNEQDCVRQNIGYMMAELMTAYPAITQGFQECLRMLLGRSILKPNVFPQLVMKTYTPPNFERGRSYQETLGRQKAKDVRKAREKEELTQKIRSEGQAGQAAEAVCEEKKK
jgi:hypothetical protein